MQITIQEAVSQLQTTLSQQGNTSAQDAWWLIEHITQKTYSQLVLDPTRLLTLKEIDTLQEVLNDIKNDKPLAYIIGWVPFIDLTLRIKPPILIPRSETEYWCNELITQLKQLPENPKEPLRILDMCTGSGCIALALAQALPHAQITAVDSNPLACELAKQNAQDNTISNVAFIQSDLFSALPNMQFDIIVSNPPYIDPAEFASLDNSVKLWEDRNALIAAEEGFALIKLIITHAREALRFNENIARANIPQLWLEIGHQQGSYTKLLMEQASFCKVSIMKDIYQKDRFVTALLHH